ncbi:hypothetical protein BDV18DRAFT_94349 [Aspergillus unguis]
MQLCGVTRAKLPSPDNSAGETPARGRAPSHSRGHSNLERCPPVIWRNCRPEKEA